MSAISEAAKRRTRARRGEGERLREEIVDATMGLLIETGDADAVSIRAIADAVGVTPPSIYLHFASKEELVMAACERQFRALEAKAEAEAAGTDDPVGGLKAMGRAYVRFGLEHPEEYRFLFMSKTPEWAEAYMRERISDLAGFTALVNRVQRCIDAGAFGDVNAFAAACQLWSGMHGVTSLLISKPGFPWPDDFVERCLDTACRGLGA